jgi:hypothetical protein
VFYLLNAGGSQLGWPAYSSQTVANSFGGGVGSVSITAVVSVPTGVAQTYRLGGFETLGTAEDTTLFGTLTATYVPFLGDGTNPAVLAPPIAPDDPVLNPAGN